MNKLRENMRRASWCSKVFGDEFYLVSTTIHDITLQAYYSSKIAAKAVGLGFDSRVEYSGFVILSRGVYKIVLT
jgi:hypothetical protein